MIGYGFRQAFLLLTATCIATLTSSTYGQCTRPPNVLGKDGKPIAWANGSKIQLRTDASLTPTERQAIGDAIKELNATDALTSHNISFALSTAPPPTNGKLAKNIVSIRDEPTQSPNDVAFNVPAFVQEPDGSDTDTIAAGNVFLNKGYSYSPGKLQYDPSLATARTFFAEVIRHELLHILGLADIVAPVGASGKPNSCLETPGASAMNGVCGTNDQGDGVKPGVQPAKLTSCDNDAVKNPTSQGGTQSGGGSGLDSGLSCMDASPCPGASCNNGVWDASSCGCQGNVPCAGALCNEDNYQWDTTACYCALQTPCENSPVCDEEANVWYCVDTGEQDDPPPCSGAVKIADGIWNITQCCTADGGQQCCGGP